ncbi:hemolymph lipopolysaccharide-binding protein-like [Haliotis cracherodii]|uniref:hemolymph lipopolysaccharide-binding protein-like n=1 Tax=Haliotis cracherodii TaxID=6455 RepID=UPI0039EC845B
MASLDTQERFEALAMFLEDSTTAAPTTTVTTTTLPTTTTTTTTTTTRTTTTTTVAAPVTGPVMYTYHDTNKFWNEARTICIQNGGDMASLDTQERFDAVKKFLNDRKRVRQTVANSLFVGITRSAADGKLYWTNGALMDSNDKWAGGFPRAGESCGYTAPFENMIYRTYDCSTFSSSFLCQTPA